MRPQNAMVLLSRVLEALPPRRWWILLERKKDDKGISKAFSIPRADIEALLVNAGIYTKTIKGKLFFRSHNWEIFQATLPDSIQIGSIRKNLYVSFKKPPHLVPSDQENSRIRISASSVLSDDLFAQLKISSKSYDEMQEQSAHRARAAVSAEADAAAEKAKAEAQLAATKAKERSYKLAFQIQYPLLSKVVTSHEEVTLDNPAVEQWAKMATIELNLLHSHANKKVVLLSLDDSTIPIPLSLKRKAVSESEGSETEVASDDSETEVASAGSDTELGSSKEDNVRNA